MAETVYKFSMMKFIESWYKLSSEEQNAAMAKVSGALKEVGGESVIFCAMPGASPWMFLNVEKFPNMDAVNKHTMLLHQIGWFRYREGEVYFGMEFEPG